MSSLAEFLEFAKPVCFWEVHADSVTRHLLGKTTDTISMDTLASYDERLPAFLKTSARSKKTYGNVTGVYGANLDDTVHLWMGHSARVTTAKGRDFIIHSINGVHLKNEHAVFSGMFTAVFTRPLEIGGLAKTVEGVSDQDTNAIKVACSFLDDRFPGWAQRWSVVMSLDIKPEERSGYLFSSDNPVKCLPEALPVDITY